MTVVTPIPTEECPSCAGCDRWAWARAVAYIASWDRHLITCGSPNPNITVPMDELLSILTLPADAVATVSRKAEAT